MTEAEGIGDWRRRNVELKDRVWAAVSGLDEERLNLRRTEAEWSPAQVMEHLTLAHRPYLATIDEALARAVDSTDSAQVRHGVFGRLILKSVGPGGKAPVPKNLKPSESRISMFVITEWEGQHARLMSQLVRAGGKALSKTGVRNPFYGFIRMNLADCFEILTAHTEGHVLQIEERAR